MHEGVAEASCVRVFVQPRNRVKVVRPFALAKDAVGGRARRAENAPHGSSARIELTREKEQGAREGGRGGECGR